MTTTKNPRRMARSPAAAADATLPPTEAPSFKTTSTELKRTTKQGLVLELLKRDGGAPLNAIIDATGWLPHTARAALTGLRKKGHDVTRSKIEGETRYSVQSAPAQ